MTSIATWPNWLTSLLSAYRSRRQLSDEFATLGPVEGARTLRDAGLAPEQLPDIIRRDPDTHNLLSRLMVALGIDPGAFRREQPATLRDLEVRCTSCRTWRRCRRELAAGTAENNFAAYCPNASELEVIRAVRPGQFPGSGPAAASR